MSLRHRKIEEVKPISKEEILRAEAEQVEKNQAIWREKRLCLCENGVLRPETYHPYEFLRCDSCGATYRDLKRPLTPVQDPRGQ